MGLAAIGYIVIGIVAAGGLAGLVYSLLRTRHSLRAKSLVMLVLAAAGWLFWSMFLRGLNDTLAEAIDDGRYAQTNVAQSRLSAKILHKPEPTPPESELKKIQAMNQAKRSARLFGWDWRKLEPSYRKGAEQAPPQPLEERPRERQASGVRSGAAAAFRSPSGPSGSEERSGNASSAH
jgi:hypothetical protein